MLEEELQTFMLISPSLLEEELSLRTKIRFSNGFSKSEAAGRPFFRVSRQVTSLPTSEVITRRLANATVPVSSEAR